MNEKRKFAVFILSHGRANKIITPLTLRRQGYTGPIYIVIDDEDDQAEKYREKFGDSVIVFNKQKYFDLSDTGDNGGTRSVVLPARNALWDIAKEKGLTYFLELDDDYGNFALRDERNGILKNLTLIDLDDVFDAALDFLDCGDISCVCFSQGGDLIGGVDSANWKEKRFLKRKAMNGFFCRIDRPFYFYGRINEDTTAYTVDGNRGKIFFTIIPLSLTQKETQSNPGGLTDIYKEHGTFYKSFFSVMFCPSAVKISVMGEKHQRIHHKINWNACAPKILSDKWRK